MPRLDLRELDDRVVPAAARQLRRLVDALAAGGSARGRPLTLLLVALAAVLLGATAAAGLRPGPDEPDVALEAAPSAPGAQAPRLAVVHLARYAAPDELPLLLAGTDVRRIYLHAEAAGPAAEVVVLPVDDGDAASLLPALCAGTAERRARDARDLTTHAGRLPAVTAEEQQAQAGLQEQAARAAAEASAYAGACTTTFAAAVEAPAPVLTEVAGRAGVRDVEPAPDGASVEDLQVPPAPVGPGSPAGAR